MTAVYLYDKADSDWAGTGLVGDLQPVSCTFEEEKNGLSQITLELAYDALEKYRQVKVGRIIKCLVPVRMPPVIENNQYANTAKKYKTEDNVTYTPIYSKPSEDQSDPDLHLIGWITNDSEKYIYQEKLILTWMLAKSATAKISGYTRNATYVETVQIPANFAGLEAVSTPTRLSYQYFVIETVEQGDTSITVTASHIWNQLRNAYTNFKGADNTSYSGAAVCANIMQNTLATVPSFQVASDCTTTVSGKELDYRQKNICEAFLDPEEGVCKKFGLSLIRDNWNFYCLKEVGYDRGFVVQDGKNLLGVTRTEDITEVVTRIVPFAKTSGGEPHYMAGTAYVDSSHINDYLYPMVGLLDTELVIGQDGVTEQNVDAKLLAAAQKEFSDNHVDEPQVELDIDFVSLGDTEEYKQYRDLDKVYLYDIITVKDNTRGYNYSAQVVGIEHDVLTGQLLSVKLGSITNSDGVRKIATWQVPSVDGSNIRLQSISVGALADGSVTGTNLQDNIISAGKIIAGEVTTEKLHAGAVTTNKLAAGAVTADKIGAGEVTAAKLAADVFNAVDAEISSANIGYAQIKDASVQNLITKDAVADRYYIEKLQVQNLQVLHQTVDNLVIKAANGNYYSLDISDAGVVTPTQVTVTSGEINAGVTSSGRSIIETDLLVTDLAASNIKGANALIDKITAARLDVGELFARQATIAQLQTVDIASNTSLQVQAQNQINLTVGQLNISGTNLLTDGDKTVTNSDASIVNWYLLDELVPGQDYTFTVCLTPAAEAPYYRFFTNGNYRSEGRLVPSGTGQQVISLPFTFSGYIEGQRKYQVRLYREWEPTITNPTTVHWAKLEKGAKILPIGTSKIVSDTYSPPPMGSENLLYGSNDALDIPAGTTSASRYFPTKDGEQVFWRADDMTPGETYTFTACITPGSDMTGFTLRTCYGDQINFGGLSFTGTDGRQIVSRTFVFPSTGYTNTDHRLLGLRSPSSVTNAGTVHWAKLHRGVAREVWSPNPNEINNSSIKITDEGIDILTDATLNMSGAVEGSLNIPNGVVNASVGDFSTLKVGGKTINSQAYFFPEPIALTHGASAPPSGFKGWWFNASGSTILSASRSGATDFGWINPNTSRTVTLGAPSSTMTSGTFTYTLTFGVVNRQNGNPDSITFTLTVTIGGVTFTSSSITLRKWQTQNVTITPSATSTNLFSSTGTLTATVSSNYSGTYGPDLDGTTMTLTAQKSGTSGQQDVTIKFVT